MKDYALPAYVVGVFIMAEWPDLILPQFCTTDIVVKIESEELNENGTSKNTVEWSGKCNYQDKSKRVYSTDKSYVEITGTCLISGDIVPDFVVIPRGKAVVFGVEREIAQGMKARNPDGSVNYTKLDLK